MKSPDSIAVTVPPSLDPANMHARHDSSARPALESSTTPKNSASPTRELHRESHGDGHATREHECHEHARRHGQARDLGGEREREPERRGADARPRVRFVAPHRND